MNNFTTNTYKMKRKITDEGNIDKKYKKFIIDMIYGMNKSQDVLLSSIAHELDEKTKKINIIERLSIHLAEK